MEHVFETIKRIETKKIAFCEISEECRGWELSQCCSVIIIGATTSSVAITITGEFHVRH
jgi:hypothetical protein